MDEHAGEREREHERARDAAGRGAGAELQVVVNGEPRRVRAGATVRDLLDELGLPPAQAAVERNKALVRRADHATTALADGDRIEVVTFFGGG